MVGRTTTRFKELRDLFPASDPLACKVFQLCVLRDDLFLELIGISADEVPELDRADRGARVLYFFRRSALTLNEIATAVNSREYSQLTTDDSGDTAGTRRLKEAAREARRDLNRARDKLNYARNKAAGHVDYVRIRVPVDDGHRSTRKRLGERFEQAD